MQLRMLAAVGGVRDSCRGIVMRGVLFVLVLFGCVEKDGVPVLEKSHFRYVSGGFSLPSEYRDDKCRVTCWRFDGSLSCLRDEESAK